MTTPSQPVAALAPPLTNPLPDGRDLPARHDAIVAALDAPLDAPLTDEERVRLKHEIIALFKDADAAATQYLAFKDAVKSLASRWKQTGGPVERAADADRPAAAAVTVRVDHLGASTFLEKGWTKLSVGDAAGAEVALRRALELAPDENEAETLLGWAQMQQQQYDEALQTFQRVLRREPEHALARTNIGFIALRRKEYGDAIEHLSRAIRLDSDRKATLYAHLYLGMVYHEREMYDDAELFFARALDLGPNLLQAWYELGRARWFSGRVDEAKAAWRDGAAANKFNPWGKRCAELLAFVEAGGEPGRSD